MISVLLRNWALIDLFQVPPLLNTLFVYLSSVWNIEIFNPPPWGARSIRIKPSCLTKANVTAFKAHRNYSYFTWAPLSAEANLMMVQCTLFSESFRMHCVFYLGLSPVMRSGGVLIKRVFLSQLGVGKICDTYCCCRHDISVLLACFGAGIAMTCTVSVDD